MDTEPIISYGATVRGKCSDYSSNVLHDLQRAADVDWMLITSMERNSREQALAMFTNCKNTSADVQRKLYGPFGDQVVAVYSAGVALGLPDAEIINRMKAKVDELGPHNVSHHCSDGKVLQVIDVSPHSMVPQPAVQQFIEAAKSDHRVSLIKTPADGDPAIHLEVPQPQPSIG